MISFFKNLITTDKQKLFNYACMKGNVKKIEFLLKDKEVNPSINDNEIIQKVIHSGSHKSIAVLLNDPRVDPNINLQENIELAVENKKHKNLKIIMSNEKFDNTINISSAIDKTINYQGIKIFDILTTNNNFEKGSFSYRLSGKIFRHGYKQFAESIIKNKDIEILDYFETGLKYSISYGYASTAFLLIDRLRNEGILKFEHLETIFREGDSSYLEYLISLDLDDDIWARGVERSIKNNKVAFLKLLLKKNKIQKKYLENNDYLFYAIENRYEELFYFLFKDCNLDPSENKNNFVYAARNGNLNIMKTLLNDNRVDINTVNRSYYDFTDNETALAIAIKKSYEDIVTFLLPNKNISFSLRDNFILDLAAENNNFDAFFYIIKNHDINLTKKNYETAFVNSIIHNNTKVYSFLANEPNFDHTKFISTNLELSVEKGSFDILKLMLNEESCVIPENAPLILNSLRCKNSDILLYLLKDNRINHSYLSNDSIISSIIRNDFSQVKILISSGLLKLSDSNGIISSCIRNRNADILEYILKNTDLNPNKKDSYYDYPIVRACEERNFEIIKILFNDSRVDPSVDNNKALLNSIIYGKTDIIKLLLTDCRVTPASDPEIFSETIKRKKIEIFNLISHYDGIDFEGKSFKYNFEKPLNLAVSYELDFVVDFLINHKNIDPSADDNKLIIELKGREDSKMVNFLFKDKRIYSTLKKDDEVFFHKLNKSNIQNKIASF
jgi:hypothetical protein